MKSVFYTSDFVMQRCYHARLKKIVQCYNNYAIISA